MNFPQDFKDFLRLLAAHCVDYAIVGGYAVARHGHPRFTGDLDILIDPAPGNIGRLLETLQEFGFGSLELTQNDFLRPERVVQLGVPPLRIDLLTSVDGVTNAEVFANRVIDRDAEMTVCFIGRDQLIKNKKATGRPKDIADIEEL